MGRGLNSLVASIHIKSADFIHEGSPTQTDIEIDDEMMRQAMAISEGKTKKAVVEEALWRMVQLKRQGDAIERLRAIATWVGHDEDWFTPDPRDPEWNAELASRGKSKLDLRDRMKRPLRKFRWWMVIVDSSVLVDYPRDTTNLKNLWLRGNRGLERTTLAICKMLQGMRGERRFSQSATDLSRFEIFEIADTSLAHASAINYPYLRGLRFTVRTTTGCLIATFCIEEGYLLLHNDRDFDAFETHLGPKVLRPAVFTH